MFLLGHTRDCRDLPAGGAHNLSRCQQGGSSVRPSLLLYCLMSVYPRADRGSFSAGLFSDADPSAEGYPALKFTRLAGIEALETLTLPED